MRDIFNMSASQNNMESEMIRYSTFCGFQTPASVWPSHLAKAGFCRTALCVDNEVICFSCGLKVDVRTLVNQPLMETHVRMSPNCRYVTASTGNQAVPVLSSPTSNALPVSSLQTDAEEASNQNDSGPQVPYSYARETAFDTTPPPSFSGELSIPVLNSNALDQQNLLNIPMDFVDGISNATVDSLFSAFLGQDASELTQSSQIFNALLGGISGVPANDRVPEPYGDTRPTLSAPINTESVSPRQHTASPPTTQQIPEKDDNSAPRRAVGFSDLGIITERPKRSDMSMYHKRLQTLESWVVGHDIKQSNESIAEAGFYYAGYSDCCRCFYCGGGLKSWDESDVPWIEHARWFQTCPFVRTSKGQDFIDAVQHLANTKQTISMDDVAQRLNLLKTSLKLPCDEFEDLEMPENEEEEFSPGPDTCKICLDKQVSVLYVPCGHLVACAGCAPTMKNCPMCRQAIRGQVRVQMYS